MTHLQKLESESIYILREAYYRFKHMALLWSIGKDSTTLLWLCRKAFLGKIPFPVIHIDTSFKFREIYDFRAQYASEWGLDLVVARNELAISEGMNNIKGKFICCNSLKTETLKSVIGKYQLKAIALGIRRDEHGIRAKERLFSPRNQDFQWTFGNLPVEVWDLCSINLQADQHVRIHPLLGWREIDVWQYIAQEKIPVVDLYFAKRGKRYRSIGCQPCCEPIYSAANTVQKVIKEVESSEDSERCGRSQDKEDAYTMQKLRTLGYM